MTRESIPRFDLYGELEVSPLASVDVIEAAYRSLVKRHHPDVARPDDVERIKRLNVAREWLVDPASRRRYDAAIGVRRGSSRQGAAATVRSRPARASRATGTKPDDTTDGRSFGANASEVRRFLAELRRWDEADAEALLAARAAVDGPGYAAARRQAFGVAQQMRLAEWLLAREAATVIARGKLGAAQNAAAVAEVVADVAGALSIRDLISRADAELLGEPWRRRKAASNGTEPEAGANAGGARPAAVSSESTRDDGGIETPAAAGASTAGPAATSNPATGGAPAVAPPTSGTPRRQRPAVLALAFGVPALAAIVAATALGGRGPASVPQQEVAGITDASSNAPASHVVLDLPTALPTLAPTLVGSAPPSPAPSSAATLTLERLQALQGSADETIAALRKAAAAGNVTAARRLLGDTGRGLRASGLARATFPRAAPESIAITWTIDHWTATIGTDVLTSSDADGGSWTFDYGDRPLAWFGRTSEHDLFWLEPSGRKTVSLRVTSVTITRHGAAVGVSWRYGADASAFLARAWVSARAVVGGENLGGTGVRLGILGAGSTASGTVTGDVLDSAPVTIRLTISVPRTGGGASSITTEFPLTGG